MKKKIIDEIKTIMNHNEKNDLSYNVQEIGLENNLSLIFIDGGNNEIFSTPKIKLNIVKISTIFFNNGIRNKILNYECYLLIQNNKINLFENKKNNYSWVMSENKERNVEIFRRLNELNLAKELSQKFKNSYIIIDGTLKQQFKESDNEKSILNLIYKKHYNILSISKSNKENIDLIYNLINNSNLKNKTWKTNIINNENFNSLYAKLHSKSKYIFKIDFNSNLNQININKILNNLVHNSSDPIFQGYPYGLILADKFAKVSNNEINLNKTIFKTKINSENFEKEENFLNIHDKLDSINLP
ncbi:MAG: DNA double-strand break repair nuclease NurA [Candidatus Woesearchaeota archaeon]